MAGSSLFALLDDIATLLDDISLMSKVAAKKSASVLSDDLAVNAEQVTGMKADRELPVVWKVFKGSLKNKAILVPLALILNAVLPAAVEWLLMAGGAYLCYEGFEAIKEKISRKEEPGNRTAQKSKPKSPEELAAYEKRKVSGAIRTDFILSAEIIVITLNIVAEAPIFQQITTLVLIAVVMTVGVYGLVAGIVRMDDAGLVLSKSTAAGVWGSLVRKTGEGLLSAAPLLMKALSWIGTVAMFLVGGTFVTDGIEPLKHYIERLVDGAGGLETIATLGIHCVAGAVIGMAVALVMTIFAAIKSTANR
jgi:predicted DNA repair protein MutK